MRITVVLPQPLGPSRDSTCPCSTPNDTSLTASDRAVALGDVFDFDVHPRFPVSRSTLRGKRGSSRWLWMPAWAGMSGSVRPYATKICAIFSIQPGRSLLT